MGGDFWVQPLAGWSIGDSTMNHFIVLRKTWIPRLAKFSPMVLIGGLLLSSGLAWLKFIPLSTAMGFTLLLSVTLEFIAWWALYHLIRCPRCGHRLATFKNGKNMPINQAYHTLQNGAACRCCGWQAEIHPQINQ